MADYIIRSECRACGEHVEMASRTTVLCPMCGAEVKPNPIRAKPVDPKTAREGLIDVAIMAAFVAIIIAAILFRVSP